MYYYAASSFTRFHDKSTSDTSAKICITDQCIHSHFILPNERFTYQILNNLNFSHYNILKHINCLKVSKTILSHNTLSYRIINSIKIINSIIRIIIWKIIDKII